MIYPELPKSQQQTSILIWRHTATADRILVSYPKNMIDDLMPFKTFFYLHPETGIVFYRNRDLFGNTNYIERERITL